MVGRGGSSAGSYLDDPAPLPSNCAVIILFKSASIIVTSTLRVNDPCRRSFDFMWMVAGDGAAW